MKLFLSAFVSTLVFLCAFTNLSASEDITKLPEITQSLQKNNSAVMKDVESLNKIFNGAMRKAPTCSDECKVLQGACLLTCCYFGACSPVCVGGCTASYAICESNCDDLSNQPSSKENRKNKPLVDSNK